MGSSVDDMIQFKDLSLSLGQKSIIRNMSFSIPKGKTTVILGPSGAGKSSILKIILGLWRPASGTLFIGDTDLRGLKENGMNRIRQRMAMIFQSNALFDSLTVEENVAYFLRERNHFPENEISARVKNALEFVNLAGTEGLYPEELSGGMKKRVAIARAVVLNPEIILYDEPTTGLDPINSRKILELIAKLRNKGTTSVMVTHILDDALQVGDKFLIVSEGHLIEGGSMDDIIKRKNEFTLKFLKKDGFEEAD